MGSGLRDSTAARILNAHPRPHKRYWKQ